MTADRPDALLAIRGGNAVFPAGPPDWPGANSDVREILRDACERGLWGKYEGPYGEALCRALGELHQIEHVLTCCSGTFAVELALRALGVKPGDEVVLAGYDFPGNFRAIEAVGATPVLVDIDPRTWCLDVPSLIERATERESSACGSRTRALIVSHLHGGLADMAAVCAFARQNGIAVVEDACQATGGQVADRPAGTWGDVGVLSFGGSKLLTAGRGGAILTRDPYVYQRARTYQERGNNAFPLSELQAAVLLPQAACLPQLHAARSTNVRRLLNCLSGQLPLDIVETDSCGGSSAFYKLAFGCRASHDAMNRDAWVAALWAEGVDVGPGFRGFVKRGPRRCRQVGALPCSAAAASRTFVLHHPILLSSPDSIDDLARAFLKVQRGLELV